ncbi:MAG: tyrosine-type recombinase/integrase [Lachnoclostridium sp.]|nr:tyrosine-type recombinase/integrase [Lachnoclostridium sp.]
MTTQIDSFIEYLRLELNYSDCTVSAYRSDLRAWAQQLTAGKPETLNAADVAVTDLRLWLAEMSREGLAASTIRRKVQSVRAFYRYLMCHHGATSNPASALTLPKLPRRLPLYIRPEETSAMLDEADREADTDFISARNALILELLYATGMRCSELTGLKDINVNTSSRELKVHGKRNKDRIIPIGPSLASMIDGYRTMREASPATAQGLHSPAAPLLVSAKGAPLNRRTVYSVVNDAMSAAGIHAARLSPHVMRHSCATDMLNAGADLNSVKQLLGHASLASTQVYTHISNRELQLNYQHAHPRALKKGG